MKTYFVLQLKSKDISEYYCKLHYSLEIHLTAKFDPYCGRVTVNYLSMFVRISRFILHVENLFSMSGEFFLL